MIPKEAAVLAAAVVAGYFILKSDTGAGFGGAGGEGVEKKEPSEAGDIIYNIPEPVDYSGVLQELLGGQPTYEEIFPEPDPYRAPIDEPKKLDTSTEISDPFLAWHKEKIIDPTANFANWISEKLDTPLLRAIVGEPGEPYDPSKLSDYMKEYDIYGKKISDIGKEIIPRQEQAITLGAVFKPEERGIPTYDEDYEVEGLKKTARHYGEQTPGYLATGVYERMSGAFKVLGPTHPGSSYYKTTGYTPPTSTGGRILTKKGRGLRVGEFRERYNVPKDYSYPVTRRIKVTN